MEIHLRFSFDTFYKLNSNLMKKPAFFFLFQNIIYSCFGFLHQRFLPPPKKLKVVFSFEI